MPSVTTSPRAAHLAASLDYTMRALDQRQYFKLICGGSFTDTNAIADLMAVYLHTPLHAVDLAADPQVVATAVATLTKHLKDHPTQSTPLPTLMVSMDVDGDPHFRKAVLDPDPCILCHACVPVCPTAAVVAEPLAEAPRPAFPLHINAPRCYGCSACVDACPTDALAFERVEQPPELMVAVLTNPWVQAVELHTTHLDVASLEAFLTGYGPYLANKLLSLCWRPGEVVDLAQEQAFIEVFTVWHQQQPGALPWMIQVDGTPMGGAHGGRNDHLAFEAAHALTQRFPHPPWRWLTLSGGIRPETAELIRAATAVTIHGVGMGSIAKKLVWAVPAANGGGASSARVTEAMSVVRPFLLA